MFYSKADLGDSIATTWGNNTEASLAEHTKGFLDAAKDPVVICMLASIARQSLATTKLLKETNKLLKKLDARLKPLEDASKIALEAGKQRERQIQAHGYDEL